LRRRKGAGSLRPALAPEDYYPKNNVLPDRIEGLDLAMADAVSFKYVAMPLTKEQLATLILVPFK